MLNKGLISLSNSVNSIKERITEKLRSASGMEMLQMVLIIGIAVAVAAAFYAIFKPYFTGFLENVNEKMNDLFDF